MSKFYYKVLAAGFMNGKLCEPGGKHDPVVLDSKLKPVPTWLEQTDSPAAKAKTTGRAPMGDTITKVKGIQDVKLPGSKAPAAKKAPATKKGTKKKPKDDLEVI